MQDFVAEELETVSNAQNHFEDEVDEVKAMLSKSNRLFKHTHTPTYLDDEFEMLKDRQNDYEVKVDEHLLSIEAKHSVRTRRQVSATMCSPEPSLTNTQQELRQSPIHEFR